MLYKKKKVIVLGFLSFLIICIACGTINKNVLIAVVIPSNFPEIIYPEDNIFSKDRWVLGKKLFFDKSLSIDSSVSCASCHNPSFAFGDTTTFSKGAQNNSGTQNTPTLVNVAYQPYYTRIGGVSTLEKQILVPIQEHNEFNFNIVEIANRLKQNSVYNFLSRKAYNREIDYYVITRALSNFERTLISGNSKYDKYLKSNNKHVFNETELNGLNLFFSAKTNCSACHSGFNFTNYAFENTGLYENYKEEGRIRLTEKQDDLEKLKVPTLRNIALTAPYMHDGSLKNLFDVVSHYNSGGKNNPRKSVLINSLNLSIKEKNELVAFLNTLTDYTFVNNKIYK